MATQFRQAVAEQLELLHLQQLNDPTAKLALEEDFAVEYDVLDDEIYIGGIYVRLFLQVIRL
eukprot:COSAG01_NODE_9275_length_2496_cov_1.895286_2_plen_62_part_00